MTSRSPTRSTPPWTSLRTRASNATVVCDPSVQAHGIPMKIYLATTLESSSSKTTSGRREQYERERTKTRPASRYVRWPFPYVS